MKEEIERPRLFAAEDLKKHIKAVGQSIIDQADRLNFDPHLTREIMISAEISPADSVTTVEWSVYADPRIGGKNADSNSDTDDI